jgi:type I restriction enzyme M protein
LFVERCLKLIKNWWRMGIILPETFFHAPKAKYVLDYLTKWNNVQRVIDLPHNTFRPHNNAKCLAIILEKWKPQQNKINMAVAEQMWHDHNGKLKYRWDDTTDKNPIWDDIDTILWEIKNWFEKHCFEVDGEECQRKWIYVPRYYRMNKFEEIKEKAEKDGIELIKLWDIINKWIIKSFDWHWSPESDNKWMGEIPYIRVKDIVNWQIYKDPTALIPEHVYNSMKWQKELKIWDIVYVRRWSYRIWSVAILSECDLKVLLTREILVLRVIKENNQYDITPFYLLYLMSHEITQEQSFSKVLIETTLPNIWDRRKELYLPIHKDPKQRKYISDKIENVITQKWKAQKDLEAIKEEFGNLQT